MPYVKKAPIIHLIIIYKLYICELWGAGALNTMR